MPVKRQITWPQGQYTVTPADRLDLLRCAWREGQPRAAVVYALLSRLALLRQRGKTLSLSRYLRMYCQPINPRWFPSGDLHKKRYRSLLAKGEKKRANAELLRANRRVVYSTTPESEIPSSVVDLVDRILKGSISNPVPGAVHFCSSFAPAGATDAEARAAAEAYAAKRSGLGPPVFPPQGARRGVNWFFRSSLGPRGAPPAFALKTTTTPGPGPGMQYASTAPGAIALIVAGLVLLIGGAKHA